MTIYEMIQDKYRFTQAENQISEYLLEHLDEVMNMQLNELAIRIYVSKATIIRYYKKLGFDSYRDFMVQLARETKLFRNTADHIGESVGFHYHDGIMEVSQKVAAVTSSAITQGLDAADFGSLYDSASLIRSSNRVYLAGFGLIGRGTVYSFTEQLQQFGKDASLLPVSLLDNTRSLQKTSACAIIVSYRQKDDSIRAASDILFEAGVPYIIISDETDNDITRKAYRGIRLSAQGEDVTEYITVKTQFHLIIDTICVMVRNLGSVKMI